MPATKCVIVGEVCQDLDRGAVVVRQRVGLVAVLERHEVLGVLRQPRATSIEPFVPWSPSLNTISAPKRRSSSIRSWLALSGITTVSGYPLRAATMASEIPVLPDVGSRIVRSAVSSPDASATSIIFFAMRSFVEPVGLLPSSFAHSRTPGFGDMRGMPTSGVFPIASRMSSKRTDGLSQRPSRVSTLPTVGPSYVQSGWRLA